LWEIVRGLEVLTVGANTELLFATAGDARAVVSRLTGNDVSALAGLSLQLGGSPVARLAAADRGGLAVRPHRVNWGCAE
jgi:hypothetical protein